MIPLNRCRVVLVQPHFNPNVGAVARLMCNFGLTDLFLVAPYANHLSDDAKRMSTHGEHILQNAKVVDTLPDALVDCRVVYGTADTADGIYRHTSYGRPDELIPQMIPALQDGPCALVFGPEPSGLTNYELSLCHGQIRILTDPNYSSMNLSQAVAVCLYELRKHWQFAQSGSHRTQPIAPYQDQELMFQKLREGLEDIHFVWGSRADSLMHALRHLIVRAQPSPNEVRLLFGLARQLKWIARNGPRIIDGAAEPEADLQNPNALSDPKTDFQNPIDDTIPNA
jgi:tRNA/rRNA methyltransferase